MKGISFFASHPVETMPSVLGFQNSRCNITATNHEMPTSVCIFEDWLRTDHSIGVNVYRIA